MTTNWVAYNDRHLSSASPGVRKSEIEVWATRRVPGALGAPPLLLGVLGVLGLRLHRSRLGCVFTRRAPPMSQVPLCLSSMRTLSLGFSCTQTIQDDLTSRSCYICTVTISKQGHVHGFRRCAFWEALGARSGGEGKGGQHLARSNLQGADGFESDQFSSQEGRGPSRRLRTSPSVLSCRHILFWPGLPDSRASLSVGLAFQVAYLWPWEADKCVLSGPRGSQSVSSGSPQGERTVTDASVPSDGVGKRPERYGFQERKNALKLSKNDPKPRLLAKVITASLLPSVVTSSCSDPSFAGSGEESTHG